MLELMLVVAIIAILATLAAPSFQRLILSSTVSNTVNTFLADMRFARSESIRRGGGVVMCRSAAPEDALPACSTEGSNGWASGWIVFQDLNHDGVTASAAALLRVQSPITSIQTILESDGNFTQFKFTATGRVPAAGTALVFGGANFDGDVKRRVCIASTGRTRIAASSATC